jgi:hypothetical protein
MIEQETLLRTGLKKRIHVDQARIRANAKNGTDIPPVTVQAQGGPYKGHVVEIRGWSSVVYDGEAQLSCGARLWIETTAEVKILVRETPPEPCCPVVDERPELTEDLPALVHGSAEGWGRGCCCWLCRKAKD